MSSTSVFDYQHSNSSSGLIESPSIVPPVLLCLLGIVGNSLAVVIVCCSVKTHQWRPFYHFVCGLAITDGFGVMFAVPFAVVRYATNFEYTYSQTVCDYMAVIQMFTIIASAMIVCTMSMERFLALLFPYEFQSLTKGARSTVILFCIWGVSAFLSSGHLMAGRPSKRFYPDSWCFVNFESQDATDRGFAYLYVLMGLLVLLTTFGTNVILMVVILKRKGTNHSTSVANKHGTRIILFLFSVVLLYSICSLPILINMLGHLTGTFEGTPSFELLGIEMATTNSIIDPWIYIIFRKESFNFVHEIYNKCTCIQCNSRKNELQMQTTESRVELDSLTISSV
ncbi:prostaglandin E2 receptor EP4 subtype-like [Saccostrea echinata]|uniref:prostaglandin E2 receptor EP4 subtype-like n=1 Tax=Saccostrea echinata TaxID=191078 RepID=UPI002A80C8C9|nr:prostaglandin E2 receptor EP4 subtype-like [Saccostrea echinata]